MSDEYSLEEHYAVYNKLRSKIGTIIGDIEIVDVKLEKYSVGPYGITFHCKQSEITWEFTMNKTFFTEMEEMFGIEPTAFINKTLLYCSLYLHKERKKI